jgi:hypothetical protein
MKSGLDLRISLEIRRRYPSRTDDFVLALKLVSERFASERRLPPGLRGMAYRCQLRHRSAQLEGVLSNFAVDHLYCRLVVEAQHSSKALPSIKPTRRAVDLKDRADLGSSGLSRSP